MTVTNSQKTASTQTSATFGDGCTPLYGKSLQYTAFTNKPEKTQEKDTKKDDNLPEDPNCTDICSVSADTEGGPLKVTEIDTTSDYELKEKIIFIENSRHFEEITSHKTGLKINLGFFSLGHESSSTSVMKQSNKTVYYIAQARRIGKTTRLVQDKIELSDHADCLRKTNIGLFTQEFGSCYINSMVKGYYSYVLIEIKCSSEQQAKDRKSQLELAAQTENGNGSASLDSGNSFSELCESFNAKKYWYSNLTDIPEELKNFSALSIADSLKLVDLVAQKDPADAPFMIKEYAEYPASLFPDLNTHQQKVFDNLKEMYEVESTLPTYQQEINDLTEASERKCDFEQDDKIDGSLTHYKTLLKYMRQALTRLDRDINADVKTYKEDYDEALKDTNIISASQLTPKKLTIMKHGAHSSKSGREAPASALSQILDPKGFDNGVRYNAKFTSYDASNKDAIGVVYYSKLPIVTNTDPAASATWLSHTIETSDGRKNDSKEIKLRDWIQENLTPWQFYHCSVAITGSEAGDYTYSVVYPPIAAS